jgi:hypothetical protein
MGIAGNEDRNHGAEGNIYTSARWWIDAIFKSVVSTRAKHMIDPQTPATLPSHLPLLENFHIDSIVSEL